MKRILFVIRDLPRPKLSVQALISGKEALSGTHSSTLLIAEGLARRGWTTAVLVMNGGELTDTRIINIDGIIKGGSWASYSHVIWAYYGDNAILESLNSAGIYPIVWAHIHAPKEVRYWLRFKKIKGLLTVSDTARLPFLRSVSHCRIGRIYNPVSPIFESISSQGSDRYSSKNVVFTGYMNVSKGAHRLLKLWHHVHKIEPKAKLYLAGSEQLYGGGRDVGPCGLSTPGFEKKYLIPIIEAYGSLEGAGIHPTGLLSPKALKNLYFRSSLGIVNPNWNEYTETFCCSAIEMLATGLPVFGVARGALPETVGLSGGAYLTKKENLEAAAHELVEILHDRNKLIIMGNLGKAFTLQHYELGRILDEWEYLLNEPDQLETRTGDWRGDNSTRYKVELLTGKFGLESALNFATQLARVIGLKQ